MLKALLDANVASVRRRVAQGDCPVEPALSVEILEHMVQDLADAAYTPRPVEGEAAKVERVETVPIDHPFSDEQTAPIWRVVVGEHCVDLDYEQAARNFAAAINAAVARPVEAGAGKLAEVERIARALCVTFGENPSAITQAGDFVGNPIDVELWELWRPDAEKFLAALTTPAGGIEEGGRHG